MTGYADERADIETRWQSQWVDGSPPAPRTPTRYEGVPFMPPSNAPWVALNILRGEALQASVGAPADNFFRHAGTVIVQIFVPMASGGPIMPARRADSLADLAADIWRNYRSGGLMFGTPYISAAEIEDPWHRVNVTCPFSRDSIY